MRSARDALHLSAHRPNILLVRAQLIVAQEAAAEAGSLLLELTDDPDKIKRVNQVLEYELSTEAACLSCGKWQWHACGESIVITLVCGDAEPVLALVWDEREMTFATLDGGAFVLRTGEADAMPATAGGASDRYQVIQLPSRHAPDASTWSAEEKTLIEHFSTKWPLRLRRSPRRRPGWRGLLDVVLGRADVAVTPPRPFRRGSEVPSPPVLCALHLLLSESGGCLSDVFGGDIDLANPEGAHALSRGLLACETSTHNFIVASTRSCFRSDDNRLAERLMIDLSGLGEKLKGFSDEGFTVHYEDGFDFT